MKWLDVVFDQAAAKEILGVALFAHERPFGYRQVGYEQRGPGYDSFNRRLAQRVRELRKLITFVHGSGANLLVDNPLSDARGLIKKLSRVRVFDQDDDRAVVINVKPNSKSPFGISVIPAIQD